MTVIGQSASLLFVFFVLITRFTAHLFSFISCQSRSVSLCVLYILAAWSIHKHTHAHFIFTMSHTKKVSSFISLLLSSCCSYKTSLKKNVFAPLLWTRGFFSHKAPPPHINKNIIIILLEKVTKQQERLFFATGTHNQLFVCMQEKQRCWFPNMWIYNFNTAAFWLNRLV